MATTVGPARDQADNSADRSLIAAIVWLPVRRFHVGTRAKTLTSDAGYTTATDSRVDLPTASLFLRGGRPYMRGYVAACSSRRSRLPRLTAGSSVYTSLP